MPSAGNTCNYRGLTAGDAPEIEALYRAVGWWEADWTPDFIVPMVAGSFATVGVFFDGRMAGMARAISDGASDGYIQDVMVLPEFRGRGLAAEMVRRLTAQLEAAGVGWIGLIGVPGTERLYARCGFRPMAEHIPMCFSAKKE